MNDEIRDFPRIEIRPIALLKQSWAMHGSDYWLFVGIVAVGLLIGGSVPIVLIGPALCGISICYLKKLRGEKVKFEDLFKGFDHFVESLVATVIIVATSFVLLIPVVILIGITAAVDGGGGFLLSLGLGLGSLLWFVLTAAVWGAAMFVHPLIADRGMKAVPAVKTSIRAFRANLGPMVLLVLTLAFFYALGIAACYLPAFLVAPLNLGATMLLYEHLFSGDHLAAD